MAAANHGCLVDYWESLLSEAYAIRTRLSMATNVTLYKVLLLPAAKLYGYFAPIMAFANWSHAAETLVEEVEQTEANLQYA